MKYTALLLCALLAFASCNISFLPKGLLSLDDSDTSESSSDIAVDDFLTSFASSFGLDKPTEIINCFSGDKSRAAFVASVYEKYELLKDTTERNNIQVHIDYAKLVLIYKALESTFACVFITNDMTDLLDALNLTKRDPKNWGMSLYINYQAHYDDLYEAYKPLIASLDAKNYSEAGKNYGDVLRYTVDTIKKEGSRREAFNGFGNGFSIALDIDEPSDSLECYDSNSSTITLDFLYKLSVAVTNGSLWEAPVNTLNFWENEGQALLEQIPKDVMDCDSQSNDHQTIIQTLGIDNYSDEFYQLLKRYINNHRLSYYGYMNGLKSSFEDHNFVHAGNVWGEFVSDVAAKKD